MAKTRAAIQHATLRLFREQDHEATTIEQIFEAAEIAPSTCFRYFPAKEFWLPALRGCLPALSSVCGQVDRQDRVGDQLRVSAVFAGPAAVVF
jgi:AcrR family transcriptional regulator